MDSSCPFKGDTAMKNTLDFDNSQGDIIPISSHLKTSKYGANQYLLILSFLSPYHLIGLGLFTSLFLPTLVIGILSIIFLIYPVIKQLLRYYHYLPIPHTKDIIRKTYMARCDGDFVVFLIGVRPNGANPLAKSFSEIGHAFRDMIVELESDPSLGYMGGDAYIGANERKSSFLSVQYWRDLESLQRWTHTRMGVHMKTMSHYMKSDRFNGECGIWHETYKVKDGEYEAVYVDMPPIGLALATQAVYETKINNALGRLERRNKEKQAQDTARTS